MYDIVIIGAGTAGLTAAIYAVRGGKSALVIEAYAYGGQIINTPDIENYPGIMRISGFDFATGLYEQAEKLGTEFAFETVKTIRREAGDAVSEKTDDIVSQKSQKTEDSVSAGSADLKSADSSHRFTVITDQNEYQAKAVIIATGAKNRTLGIKGEDELLGRGISYCATCDGMFFKGKDVAVNGGGNTAVEDATFLSAYCNKVYIIHRRDAFRADQKEVDRLREKENVEFVLDSEIEELKSTDGKLSSIMVHNKKTDEITELQIAGLFVAIGQVPAASPFSDVCKLDEKGYIVAGEDTETGTPGIYTAGDCRTKQVRQLTTAASDGAVAALRAINFIDEMA